MENVIIFTRYWYLIKRTTNSAGIRANWINFVLYKVLLNLHIFPVLNIYCTEPYLGPVQRSYVYLYWQSHGPLIPIKIIVQFFECRIPERVLLNGAISICRRFSEVSHRFEAKLCGLSLLAIFTFWVFTLWHITLVLYSKRKSRITAPVPLTTKLISKQARLNVTNSVLVPVKKKSLFRWRNLLFQLFCPRKWRYFLFSYSTISLHPQNRASYRRSFRIRINSSFVCFFFS